MNGMRALVVLALVICGCNNKDGGSAPRDVDVGLYEAGFSDTNVTRDRGDKPDGTGCGNTCKDGDGCCGAGCHYRNDDDCPICDPAIGIPTPMVTCSTEDPCKRLLPTYTGITEITDPVPAASKVVCKTTSIGLSKGRPVYDDGPPRSWKDADGLTRHWCEHRPPATSTSSKRPLVIYIHGSGGMAHTVYDTTSLRTKAIQYDLSGDPARPGFVLVATQGRHLHWPSESPQDGTKHDTYHRHAATPSTNRDVAFVDHIVDTLASEGVIDTRRIYISGWSNGGRFSAIYGVARHTTPTPAGHRVAAIAPYSSGDPYEDIKDGQTPSCKLAAYPTTTVPFFLISRTCDAVACDAEQDKAFKAAGYHPTPGNIAGDWIQTLKTTMQDPNVTWQLVSGIGTVATQCTSAAVCTMSIATLNHMRWPDGVADKSGKDHEPKMLDFLRQHPLP
jgi:poly(3-hydroxybutyrate) depolymerase